MSSFIIQRSHIFPFRNVTFIYVLVRLTYIYEYVLTRFSKAVWDFRLKCRLKRFFTFEYVLYCLKRTLWVDILYHTVQEILCVLYCIVWYRIRGRNDKYGGGLWGHMINARHGFSYGRNKLAKKVFCQNVFVLLYRVQYVKNSSALLTCG